MKRDFTNDERYSFTVSYVNCTGKGYNCEFANEMIVRDLEDFNKVCLKDHVLGVFKNHYRSIKNFIRADALGMDCDNEHSNDPADWVTSKEVKKAFKDVPFYVSYSRNHMKVKKNKSARPRFHVIFLIDPITDLELYAALKKRFRYSFPTLITTPWTLLDYSLDQLILRVSFSQVMFHSISSLVVLMELKLKSFLKAREMPPFMITQ